LSLRVKVRKGDLEVEISGSSDQISSEVESLKTLMGRLQDAFSSTGSTKPERVGLSPVTTGSPTNPSEVPSIGRAATGSDATTKLLSTEWGKQPRSLGEIRSALSSNAMPYPSTTISGILVHLVKAGKVRRWKTPAGFVYRETQGALP
jgi:hypothetical protein